MDNCYKKYNEYLSEHRHNVRKALLWIEEKCPAILDDIADIEQIDLYANVIGKHDVSKYDSSEFTQYAEYFYGPKDSSGKPLECNRKLFDIAWNHHQKSNPHHWEYWVLIEDGEMQCLEIPKVYIIEMICDWMSFSIKNNDMSELFSFYERKKDTIKMHPESRKVLEQYLDIIKKTLEK